MRLRDVRDVRQHVAPELVVLVGHGEPRQVEFGERANHLLDFVADAGGGGEQVGLVLAAHDVGAVVDADERHLVLRQQGKRAQQPGHERKAEQARDVLVVDEPARVVDGAGRVGAVVERDQFDTLSEHAAMRLDVVQQGLLSLNDGFDDRPQRAGQRQALADAHAAGRSGSSQCAHQGRARDRGDQAAAAEVSAVEIVLDSGFSHGAPRVGYLDLLSWSSGPSESARPSIARRLAAHVSITAA